MKINTILFLFLMIAGSTYGQDGSDIRYYKTSEIDRSFIGQFVHFDFFNRSFNGQISDTVVIVVGRKPIVFVEHRSDNGYENWFSEQCLYSADKGDGSLIKIPKFLLEGVEDSSFKVIMYLDYYDSEDKLLIEKSIQIEKWFEKDLITEVLVSTN